MGSFPVQFVLQSIEKSSGRDLASKYDLVEYSTSQSTATGYMTGTLVSPEVDLFPTKTFSSIQRISHRRIWRISSLQTFIQLMKRGDLKFAVPPGSYVIGFNTFSPPSASAYPPTYYPSAQQRSTAVVVGVSDKQHVEPRFETLTFADGSHLSTLKSSASTRASQ